MSSGILPAGVRMFRFRNAMPRGVAAVNIYVANPLLTLTLMLDNFLQL